MKNVKVKPKKKFSPFVDECIRKDPQFLEMHKYYTDYCNTQTELIKKKRSKAKTYVQFGDIEKLKETYLKMKEKLERKTATYMLDKIYYFKELEDYLKQ